MKNRLWIILALAVLFSLAVFVCAEAALTLQQDEDGWYVNMPNGDHWEELIIPEDVASFKLYDNGGKNGNYIFQSFSSMTLRAPEDSYLKVYGTFTGEAGTKKTLPDCIVLIRDNKIESIDPEKNGIPVNVGPLIINSGDKVVITLKDYNYQTFAGLDLTVEVVHHPTYPINIPSFENGTVTCDKTVGIPGRTVTLSATPAEGYILGTFVVMAMTENGFEEVESFGGNGWWQEGQPITFTMPEKQVFIYAIFTKRDTVKAYYYHLPTSGTRSYINLTNEIRSFEMYCHNGLNNVPTIGDKGYVVIIGPEGSQIRVKGKTDVWIKIYYDEEIDPLLSRWNFYTPGLKEIDGVFSPENVMQIYYEVREKDNCQFGIDLKFEIFYDNEVTFATNEPEHVKIEYFNPKNSATYDPEKYWTFYVDPRTGKFGTKSSIIYQPGEEVYVFVKYPWQEYVINNVYAEYDGIYIQAKHDHWSSFVYNFTMPNKPVTLHAIIEKPVTVIPEIRIDYRVLLNDFTHGTITIADYDTFYMDETVTLTVTPDEGYKLREEEFRAETVSGKQPVEMTKTGDNTWQFTMPEDDVQVFAIFDQDVEIVIDFHEKYDVTVSGTEHGTVIASAYDPLDGSPVTLTVTADPGYELESLRVLPVSGEGTVDVTETDSNTWTFVMPKMPVRVEAVFADVLRSVLTGKGTENEPYLIQSAEDWLALSRVIALGMRTDGFYFRLTENIEISTMLGTLQTPFSGVLEGMDHTLTILQGNSHPDGFAPFRAVSGATIRNLKIKGTFSGTTFCSGLIGQAEGENLIQGCIFDGTVAGTSQAAVFVSSGKAGSSTTLSGCLDFSGAACPLGRGAGTVTVTNTYVTNPDQLTAAADSWAGKGGILCAVDCDPFLDMRLSNDSAWFQNEGTIYAPAGEQIQMTAPIRTGETPYGIIFLSENQEEMRLMPDENGVFTFNMPERNVTAHWGCLITFVNEDGAELMRGMYMPGELPEYTGVTPVKPDDARNRYTFMGWTPSIGNVMGNTVYTAVYAVSTILHEGVNTVNNLEEYEEAYCPFTPQESGYYRFWSASDGLSLILRIYDDNDTLIGYCFDGTGSDLNNFDCTVELEGGRTYTAEITSQHDSGSATVTVERATMHNLTVAPYNTEEGEIYCPEKAREGELLYFYIAAKEGYGVSELTLTGPDGQVVAPADDGAYYMPTFDVTVTVRFAWTNTIGFASDPHIHFETVDVGDEIMAAEDYPDALPGVEVKVCFYCDEGFEYESAIVVADDGSILPSRITLVDMGMQLYELCFTMPDQFVMVQILSQRLLYEAPATDVVLPNGLHEIGEAAFEGDNLQTVFIPNGCTLIGAGAFRDCKNLTAVVLPGNCAIRADAFDGCPHVTLYSTPGSLVEAWCLVHSNCDFAAISP